MILITGAAGFIGMHLAARLLARGEQVLGLDDLNGYYAPSLKRARIEQLQGQFAANFSFLIADVADVALLAALVEARQPRVIIHLAAQAGVRFSLQNPMLYERANCGGHLSMLEASLRSKALSHIVYASSSSVYGDRPLRDGAFRESDPVDRPASIYAATKRACELMSQTYAGLYGLPQTGLRFFTVYGPWGRPDMAYFDFAKKLLRGEPLQLYGHGLLARDFTFIDDIIDGVLGVLEHPPQRGEHRLLNIGDNRPIQVNRMVEILEEVMGVSAEKIYLPKQPGDVEATYANIEAIQALTGYRPKVLLEEGLQRFGRWFKSHGEAFVS